jgi:redox-sensitive bicupin YhaK (pirin superfamily)
MGPAGADGLDLSQDARALVAHLTAGHRLEHAFAPGRGGYVYVIDGRVEVDDEPLRTGDAI